MSWHDVLTALGLVAVIEGLALALAPRRMEDLLEALAALPLGQRRTIALSVIGVGVVLIWLARTL